MRNARALAWLASRRNFEAAQGADTAAALAAGKSRMRLLLRELGDPHTALPGVIHVAGSKGKGSTCEFVSSMLRCAGLRVGVYASPHVVSFGERVRVDGRSAIAPDAWTQLVECGRVAAERVDDASLTHFEIVTALALRHFIDERVDVAVVEVGMGGEDDATNVFGGGDNLAAAVVTHIGMDHAEHLGGTLESIAAHKAGVCARGAPLLLAEQGADATRAVERAVATVAAARGVELERVEDVVRVTRRGGGARSDDGGNGSTVRFEWSGGAFDATLRMSGAHQARNAATAVHAALRFARGDAWARAAANAARCGRAPFTPLDSASLARGAAAARLPGRFEVARRARVAGGEEAGESAAAGARVGQLAGEDGAVELVLDCAHNVDAARALRCALDDEYPVATGWSRTLVVAMAADKDTAGFAAELAPTVLDGVGGSVVVASVPIAGSGSRSALADDLAALWRAALGDEPSGPGRRRCGGELGESAGQTRVVVCESVAAALEHALGRTRVAPQPTAGETDVSQRRIVCVTGSTYCVGAAHELLEELGRVQ